MQVNKNLFFKPVNNWIQFVGYLIAFMMILVIFRIVINPFVFIPAGNIDHVIDEHLFHCPTDLFHPAYVQIAAHQYRGMRYLLYLFGDLAFIAFYTTTFLKFLQHCRTSKNYLVLLSLVCIGTAFDILENLCFMVFLYSNSAVLPTVIATATTFKSIFFPINFLIAFICQAIYLKSNPVAKSNQ